MEPRDRYHELCRLCASYDAVKMDIFGQEGRNRQLVDKIQTCLPFKIAEDDRLPKCLCYRCMYNLENFYDFRTACVNAVALLERCLPPSENADDKNKTDSEQCNELRLNLLKEKESVPMLIPEAPVVNPNAALGTPPRLNSDGEADQEIEEILDNSGTDEATVVDDSEDRKSDEYEMDMETNPSDFLEMTPMVTDDNEECESRNTTMPVVQEPPAVFQHTAQQHEVYVCSLCNKAFSSKGHLSLHARIHVGAGDVIGEKVLTDDHTSYKRPYQCDLCNKSYSTAKHRWGHVSTTHRGHPAVTCGYCSRIYSTRTNLEEHIKSRHAGMPAPSEMPISFFRPENRYPCKTCPKVFTDLGDLNAHGRVCGEDQRMELLEKNESHVKKTLVDTSDISSIDTDDENKDYKNAEAKLAKNPQLTILKQALTKGDSLKREYDTKLQTSCDPTKLATTDSCDIKETAEKRWYCEACPQNFTTVEGLKEHETTHEAEKPYVCILCKKDFVLKSSLSRHILTLHGVDPCPIVDSDKCLKKAITTQTWNEQIDVNLYEEKPVKGTEEFPLSPETNLENDEEDTENNHENMIEIETVFVCEICTRDFNDRASLWLHIRATHKEFAAFACGVCLKICSDNAQLLNHVNMYHGGSKLLMSEQRRYSCTICGRQHDSRKKLIAHVSIHNIDPAYDPANFVQLNSNYYNDNLNGNEGNEQMLDFDGDDSEKVDCYICYKSFPNEDHLIRHQRNAHKSEQMVSMGESPGNGNTSMNGNGNKAQYHLFFVCELCGSSHPSKWERWLHVSSTHSNEASIKCEREDCGKIFATKSLRNEHVQHHLIQGASPNTCEICGKLWGSRVDYWKHVMGVHSDTVPLICGVCLKVFPDVMQLSTHVKTKHWPLTNGDFSCDICGRPYSNKSKMSRHRKIHGLEDGGCDNGSINEMNMNESGKLDHHMTTEMELTCELCADLKFTGLESLCNHRRIAHGLFPCDLCNKCYGRTSHLWKHVNRVHKGHADVTCPYCLKTSASKDHLAAHIMKIHRYEPDVRKETKDCSGFKSPNIEDGVLHYCEKCNKGFHKRYLLRRHMKGCQNYRKDPGALLTRCRACERIFKDRASLQKHIENHHSTYTCHLCDETITSKLGIMTHNRIKHMDHPDLTCDYSNCKKLFRTKEDLESHRKDHKYHSNPNVCDFCGDTVENKLKLKMHVLSLHRNEIGVSCGVCLIPMKDPKDLKKHVEDVHGSVLTKPNTCQVCGKQYASKWKAFDHTKKCHGKVFRTCKQCLAVFTDDTDIRNHYEHVHNVPKDQLAAFEYRMDIGGPKPDDYETPDIVVKEEPDDIEFDEDLCDEDSNESKRRRSPSDTYDCEMCPEIFLNYETLSKHYQNVHNTDPVRMFKKLKQDNAADKRKMRNRKNFECKNCKKQFCTKTLFWNHINICTRRNSLNRLDMQDSLPTSILESHLKNNNQIKREEPMPAVNETNLNIPDFNLFEDINLQLSGQKPVPNLMPLPQIKSMPPIKYSRKDSRKVYDESTNTECACEVCGKQWPAKKHLWQHLIRFHRAEAAVTCGVCLKLCKNYEDLADHLKATHSAILSCEGNNFTCKTCGRYHNARSKLLLHMSIHIGQGNFWCRKCQQQFPSEEKLNEHCTSCNSKSEFVEQANADSLKNETDEKGSLIADETSMIEEAEEAEDYESEAEAAVNDNSEDDSDDNSDDSDSVSNTTTSDEEREGEGEGAEVGEEEEEDEEEEEGEDEEAVEEGDDEDDDDDDDDDDDEDEEEEEEEREEEEDEEEEEEEVEMEMEEDNESEGEIRSNSRATGEMSCDSESESEDSDSDNMEIGATDNGINCFRIRGSEEDRRNSMEHRAKEEKSEIVREEENKRKRNSALAETCEDETKEFIKDEKSDTEMSDDDGPPVLSPIMPLLPENESEEHSNTIDRMRHKLSPMVPLSNLSAIRNDGENNTNSPISNSMPFYENEGVPDDPDDKHLNTLSSRGLPFKSEDFERPDDEENCESSDNEKELEIAEKSDCNSVNGFEKLEVSEGIMDEFEEVSLEENADEDMDIDERNDDENQQVQIQNLDGTVLMVANDSEGNQILIQQNVLTGDSNVEHGEYIYQENSTYEIEEGLDMSRNETDTVLQQDVHDISDLRNSSDNDDSTAEDDDEDTSGLEK